MTQPKLNAGTRHNYYCLRWADTGNLVWSGRFESHCVEHWCPGMFWGGGKTVEMAERMSQKYVDRYQTKKGT